LDKDVSHPYPSREPWLCRLSCCRFCQRLASRKSLRRCHGSRPTSPCLNATGLTFVNSSTTARWTQLQGMDSRLPRKVSRTCLPPWRNCTRIQTFSSMPLPLKKLCQCSTRAVVAGHRARRLPMVGFLASSQEPNLQLQSCCASSWLDLALQAFSMRSLS